MSTHLVPAANFEEAASAAESNRAKADVTYLRSLLGEYPDFPQPGIVFLDIFPIFRSPFALETLFTHLVHHITTVTLPRNRLSSIDVVVGLDARGFLLGPPLALRLHAAFVPVRKKGKLPGECVKVEYEKEYGTDMFEMQAHSIAPGQSVIVIDDLIATGGSAKAAGELVGLQGSKVLEYLFVVGLPFLKGHEKLDAPAYWMVEGD
ncbi:PRTase-like protein [Calocera cornea HHB12733]|uniref:adenine phosphoribosyltransferase n=1 Tax=Calocera cornea HHB12733 TaxID=1353952 RepID=A0A165H3S3_9BASI|nr:PRTase-like protein [Calocera cornea HHB12733]